MRLYISADMEGIVGVATRDHLAPEGFEYQRAREWFTDTVVAAAEAAHEVGVEEVVVSDSHGNGESLLIERLPDYVQLIRSWPRPLMMMQGVELGDYVGAMLLGYHTGASNPNGILAHTIHGTAFREIRINGKPVPEGAISAATAGELGVPVIMASGDDHAMAELASFIPDLPTVVTKWSYSTKSTRTLTPAVAHRLLREGVKAALTAERKPAPFVIGAPIAIEIDFRHRMPAEFLSYLREIERVDTYSVRYTCETMEQVSKFIGFATSYNVMAVM